jgi:hypothetical protein
MISAARSQPSQLIACSKRLVTLRLAGSAKDDRLIMKLPRPCHRSPLNVRLNRAFEKVVRGLGTKQRHVMPANRRREVLLLFEQGNQGS